MSTLSDRAASIRIDQPGLTAIGDAGGFTVSSANDPVYLVPLGTVGADPKRRGVVVTETGTDAVVESGPHLLFP